MKFTCLFALLLILICQAIGLAEEVEIPDPNLRRVLELALRINAGEGITKEALASLVSLNAADKGINDLGSNIDKPGRIIINTPINPIKIAIQVL